MARKTRYSFQKLEREKQKTKKKQEKAARRDAAREDKANADPDFDPDIAHIVPGPQPLDEEVVEDESTEDEEE